MPIKSDFWSPRPYILEPVAELYEAAHLLDMAATAHIEGRTETADQLIRQADKQEIFDWSETLWGPKKQSIHRYRIDPEKPPSAAEEKRAPGRISSAVEQEVIARDDYICRFCGIPVILQKAQSVLRKAYPAALRWGPRNTDKHAAFQAMDLDIDHIVPRSLGGQNVPENLVVTCAPCNCARGNHTLAEMGLADPRRRPEKRSKDCPEDWDGLTRLVNGRTRSRPVQPEPKDGSHPKSLRPQAGQNRSAFSKIKQEGTGKMIRSMKEKFFDDLAEKLGKEVSANCRNLLEQCEKVPTLESGYKELTNGFGCRLTARGKYCLGRIYTRITVNGEVWIDLASDKHSNRMDSPKMSNAIKDYIRRIEEINPTEEGDGTQRYDLEILLEDGGEKWLDAIRHITQSIEDIYSERFG